MVRRVFCIVYSYASYVGSIDISVVRSVFINVAIVIH